MTDSETRSARPPSAPKKRIGRPPKLSPDIERRIVELLRAGNYVETAAACAGIHKDTLYRWLKEGARQPNGIYGGFAVAVERAQAEAEARDVTLIATAAREDWRAAAWRLERRSYARWGEHQKHDIEHTGPGGGPVVVADADRADLRAEILGRLDRLAATGGAPAGSAEGRGV